ncbi:MAG TPA: NAD(P)/FAD-dependent oxidoreductase [Casimicrobiaceae bacterium]|nr:NAD(P)/FAD-dependent oxidoreductase [Casimicrobiaceae bacterium]
MPRSIVVIGAGPAGMAAAIEAAARGCDVTVVDESARPGGQIYRQADSRLEGSEFAEPTEQARKKRLLRRFDRAVRRIDYRAGTVAYAAFGNGEIHLTVGDHTESLKPAAVVLATGVRERALAFPGWTLPGVMFAGGAQAMLKSQRVAPGRVAVVAGCGPLPMVVASQLTRAGVKVAVLANLRSPRAMLRHPVGLWHGRDVVAEGLRYGRTLFDARVPRWTGFVPIRALGDERLEAVQLARVDERGHVVPGTMREIACDLLAINYGFVANSELAAMAGARMRHDSVAGFWLPETDPQGRTSLPWLYAAGDTAGLRGALIAEYEGTIVGAAVAGAPRAAAASGALREAIAARRRYGAFQRAVRPTLSVPPALWRVSTDDTVICRCENVRLAEIRGALDGGHRTLNAIKRNTRAGMGWCSGRMCLHSVAALAELHAGIAPAGMTTPRPLARPVAFAALARQNRAAER